MSNVEKYTLRVDRRTRFRAVERFTAKLGSAGATGSFKLVGRFYDRRTGRTLLRCHSNKVRWTAAL